MSRYEQPETDIRAIYARPIGAQLIVRLENGEEWPAEESDLLKFGFLPVERTYKYIWRVLIKACPTKDIADHWINPLRLFLERVLIFADVAYSDEDHAALNREIEEMMNMELRSADD